MKKFVFIFLTIFIAATNSLNAQHLKLRMDIRRLYVQHNCLYVQHNYRNSYRVNDYYLYHHSHSFGHTGGMNADSAILGVRGYFKNCSRDTGKIKQYSDLDKEYNKLRKESMQLMENYHKILKTPEYYENFKEYDNEYHKKDEELRKKILDLEFKKGKLCREIFEEYHTDFYNETMNRYEKKTGKTKEKKKKNKNFDDPIYSKSSK